MGTTGSHYRWSSDAAVKESRDCMKTAIENKGLPIVDGQHCQ
jgi:hypothetical protein